MSVAELYDQLTASKVSPAYAAKQLHAVPEFPVVSREEFILKRCKGKVVLDVGASGQMHDAICDVAKHCYGIDREGGPGVVGFDLDYVGSDEVDYHHQKCLPQFAGVELVVCGEVVEHLANPGWFLQRLKEQYPVPVIITVPNAFSRIATERMYAGIEAVNSDHVAWYSWKTLSVLLGRYGYKIQEAYWYNGKPRFAEGLIVVAE